MSFSETYLNATATGFTGLQQLSLVCFLFCRTSSCVCCALVFKMLQLMCLQFTWLKKTCDAIL